MVARSSMRLTAYDKPGRAGGRKARHAGEPQLLDSLLLGSWSCSIHAGGALHPPPGRPSRTTPTLHHHTSRLYSRASDPLPGGVALPTPAPLASEGIAAEITALLSKGVIEPTADRRLCLSPIFLVSKRYGIFRLILNPKDQSLHPAHFGMESLRLSFPLNPGDWTVSPKRRISLRAYSRSVKRLARLYFQRKCLSLQGTALSSPLAFSRGW